MVITGYMLNEAIRRCRAHLAFTLGRGVLASAAVAVEDLASLAELKVAYGLIVGVNVRYGDGVVQMTLYAASRRIPHQKALVAAAEAIVKRDDSPSFSEFSDRHEIFERESRVLAALQAAVAEGRADKVDTVEHELGDVGRLFA